MNTLNMGTVPGLHEDPFQNAPDRGPIPSESDPGEDLKVNTGCFSCLNYPLSFKTEMCQTWVPFHNMTHNPVVPSRGFPMSLGRKVKSPHRV